MIKEHKIHGFQVYYFINDEYWKNSLLPCLKKLKYFKTLNEKFNNELFAEHDIYDEKLMLIINADTQDEYDLSKPNVQIPKFSIKRWSGDIYLNFNCTSIPREKSNVKIGSLNTNVIVKEYNGLLGRLTDFLINTGAKKTKENRIK